MATAYMEIPAEEEDTEGMVYESVTDPDSDENEDCDQISCHVPSRIWPAAFRTSEKTAYRAPYRSGEFPSLPERRSRISERSGHRQSRRISSPDEEERRREPCAGPRVRERPSPSQSQTSLPLCTSSHKRERAPPITKPKPSQSSRLPSATRVAPPTTCREDHDDKLPAREHSPRQHGLGISDPPTADRPSPKVCMSASAFKVNTSMIKPASPPAHPPCPPHTSRPQLCSDPEQLVPQRKERLHLPRKDGTPKSRKVLESVGKAALVPMELLRPPPEECRIPSNIAPGCLLIFDRAGGLYEHWAVYIGNGQVVHLTGGEATPRPSLSRMVGRVALGSMSPCVQVSMLSDVIKRCSTVKVDDDRHQTLLKEVYPAQAVVERALSMVGCPGYHVAFNNCEHFATWCRYGMGYSKQSGSFFKALPLSTPSAIRRAESDKNTHDHTNVHRLEWALVFSRQAGTGAGHGHCGPVKDVNISLSPTFPDISSPSRSPDGCCSVTTLMTSSRSWMSINRRLLARSYESDSAEGCEVIDIVQSPQDGIDTIAAAISNLQHQGRKPSRLVTQGNKVVILHTTVRDTTSSSVKFTASPSISVFKDVCRRCYRQKRRSWVISLTFFNGYWLALWEKNDTLQDQNILVKQKLPLSHIREKWQAGYAVSSLAGGDQWIVIMDKSRASESSEQVIESLLPGQCLPVERIKSHWRDGYVLSHATGN